MAVCIDLFTFLSPLVQKIDLSKFVTCKLISWDLMDQRWILKVLLNGLAPIVRDRFLFVPISHHFCGLLIGMGDRIVQGRRKNKISIFTADTDIPPLFQFCAYLLAGMTPMVC